jgi:hypothetical protein
MFKTLVPLSVVVSLAVAYVCGYRLIWGLFYTVNEALESFLF